MLSCSFMPRGWDSARAQPPFELCTSAQVAPTPLGGTESSASCLWREGRISGVDVHLRSIASVESAARDAEEAAQGTRSGLRPESGRRGGTLLAAPWHDPWQTSCELVSKSTLRASAARSSSPLHDSGPVDRGLDSWIVDRGLDDSCVTPRGDGERGVEPGGLAGGRGGRGGRASRSSSAVRRPTAEGLHAPSLGEGHVAVASL